MIELIQGDCLDVLPGLEAESVNCCVTSPPYWGLRDYGVEGQVGLEESPEEYVAALVRVFGELHRVMKKDGTFWLNIGDCYSKGTNDRCSFRRDRAKCVPRIKTDSGLPPKNLMGMPWRVAFALEGQRWVRRSAIIWEKPNARPESAKDRPRSTYEHVFLFTKSPRYSYNIEAVRSPYSVKTIRRGNAVQNVGPTGITRNEDYGKPLTEEQIAYGANVTDVWRIPTQPSRGNHRAVMPYELARRCVVLGCPEGGTVIDPFGGTGMVAAVCQDLGLPCISIELNEEYHAMSQRRVDEGVDMLTGIANGKDSE